MHERQLTYRHIERLCQDQCPSFSCPFASGLGRQSRAVIDASTAIH
ncbi:hypothetical protein [Streptomyces sp. NPDC002402]